jgi:RNA 3'-terminal phosphate cyclase (ATP)
MDQSVHRVYLKQVTMAYASDQTILHIDGSHGEGGGQILRTALALSCVLGRPFEIVNIRKARKKPGLQPQHLIAVKAAASMSKASCEGTELSSTVIYFHPVALTGGDHSFDVSEKTGSAGSTSLIFQTLLLPLLFAKRSSSVSIIGGTHVPLSPSFHYLQFVFLPLLSRRGVNVDLNIEKWGWYPVGKGRITARIDAAQELKPISLVNRGKLLRVSGVSAVSNLPRDIGVRQRTRAVKELEQRGIGVEMEIISAPSIGKGTLVFLSAEFESVTTGFDALGAIGKRAEEVADEACQGLFDYLDTAGSLDPHLADQVIPYLAMARGSSEFTTSRITQHLLTNIWVIQQFMDVDIRIEGKEGEEGIIRVIRKRDEG